MSTATDLLKKELTPFFRNVNRPVVLMHPTSVIYHVIVTIQPANYY